VAVALTALAAMMGLPPPYARAYGNYEAHPAINECALQQFIGAATRSADFTNYNFNLLIWVEGRGVIRGGLLSDMLWDPINRRYMPSVVEGPSFQTFKSWVRHGGFSADEPELHASFRHFYDPTGENIYSYYADAEAGLLHDDPYEALTSGRAVSNAAAGPVESEIAALIRDAENLEELQLAVPRKLVLERLGVPRSLVREAGNR
jgi:hypothetical protein